MDLCTCTKCDKEKPAIAFPMNRGKPRGICKMCNTATKRDREAARKADPEQNPDIINRALGAAMRLWKGPVTDGPLVAKE